MTLMFLCENYYKTENVYKYSIVDDVFARLFMFSIMWSFLKERRYYFRPVFIYFQLIFANSSVGVCYLSSIRILQM